MIVPDDATRRFGQARRPRSGSEHPLLDERLRSLHERYARGEFNASELERRAECLLQSYRPRPRGRSLPPGRPSGKDPADLEDRLRSLQERFARGDFDTAELERRIAWVLQSRQPLTPKRQRVAEWEKRLTEAKARHRRWNEAAGS